MAQSSRFREIGMKPTACTEPPWQWLLDRIDAIAASKPMVIGEGWNSLDEITDAKILKVLGRKAKKP